MRRENGPNGAGHFKIFHPLGVKVAELFQQRDHRHGRGVVFIGAGARGLLRGEHLAPGNTAEAIFIGGPAQVGRSAASDPLTTSEVCFARSLKNIGVLQELARGWKDDAETLPWLKERARSDENDAVRRAAVQELARGRPLR